MATPIFFTPSAARGTHSHATRTDEIRSGFRRFDWTHCQPYAAFCLGVLCIACLVNAARSFDVSDHIGVLFFGPAAMLTGVPAIYLALCSVLRGEA